jgi:pyruvate dehydrogenase E2 component (dihydrolipoyllysine-residue acetyltransferase)
VEEGTLVEFTRMRSAIARRMVKSKQEAPHFYVATEVEVDAAVAETGRLAAESGQRVTLTSLLVRASAAALREHPELNAVWSEEGLVRMNAINVGVAIALDDGLIAPALLGCDALTTLEVSAALRDLVERARAGKLRGSEMTGATFTLSNLGMFEVNAFAAIVTPPQVAILATGKASRVPRYDGDELVPRTVLTATVSADHRAVDGAEVGRFMNTFKRTLENPTLLDD